MKRGSPEFYYFLALILIYVLVAFLTPLDAQTLHTYHMTPSGYHILLVSVVVPLILIWLIAFYGYAKLQQYVDIIRASKDGRQVNKLTWGLGILAYGLPAESIVSGVLTALAHEHPHLTSAATIVTNYVDLVIPLIAFSFISLGARGLTEVVRVRPSQRAIQLLALLFIVIGATYCYLVFGAHARLAHVPASHHKSYYLPSWLLLFTLVVPYIYVWFIGLWAAYEIFLFKTKVAGVIYRRAWSVLAAGIGAIIVISIIEQYIVSLADRLTDWHLGNLLFLIYVLLVLLAAGFVLVAMGAKRLQRIEEV